MQGIRRFHAVAAIALAGVGAAVAIGVISAKPTGERSRGLGDFEEEAALVRRPAEEGDASAQYELGVLYYLRSMEKRGWQASVQNEGAAQDLAEAAKWYRRAAEQGHEKAQWHLASFYEAGDAGMRDHAEAAKWYRLAAEQGDPFAEANLAALYRDGRGVPLDYAEAERWYRRAADHGSPEAQFALGTMYEYGVGLPRDLVQAYMWFELAASGPTGQSRDHALEARQRVAYSYRMTPAEISEGQRLARDWKPGGQAGAL